MSQQFTHLDKDNQPQMVDISAKNTTQRVAKARSVVVVDESILASLEDGDIKTKKGPVFQTAILAGIMAAKKTSELIPLCHPVGMEDCQVHIEVNNIREIVIDCTAKVSGKTGVEMEALTGASVAALTIYDMCKAFSHHIVIRETKLMEKTGGKSDFRREKYS
ncbi:MAG: cyclic pyranopterin monophosphate synthase MoaC [Bacteroidota bacterium]